MAIHRITIIDTHTAGEPTRVVVDGFPNLGQGPMFERRQRFSAQYDRFRSAVVNEPRGSDVVVGAVLLPPESPESLAGVIFFNNVGTLGMCGHGTIGVVSMLAYQGRITPGSYRLDTPVGPVAVTLEPNGEVSVENVPSYRTAAGVSVDVPGFGPLQGDVAWGGNWFFLVEQHGQELSLNNVGPLTDFAWNIRQAVNAIYPDIDHVELFGPPTMLDANSRNFVLCPGKAYDRSPCGTGTSAKLACLAADGKLAENDPWIQESIIGSLFKGHYRRLDNERVVPVITGRAYINAETVQILDDIDPFCWGIRM